MSKYTLRHLNDNVRVGFCRDRHQAWHMGGLDLDAARRDGLVFDGPVPLEVAIKMLDWEPIVFQQRGFMSPGGHFVEGERTVIGGRITSDGKYPLIGVHGSGYRPHPYRETLLDKIQLLTHGEASLASVGCLGAGELAFATWKVGDGIQVGGQRAYPNITAGSSLDGSLATFVATGTTLAVCDNTVAAASSEGGKNGSIYRTKHTRNSKFDVAAAREAIELSVVRTEEWCVEFERAANKPFSDQDFSRLLDHVVPVEGKEGRGLTIAKNKRRELSHLWHQDPRVAPVKGSVAGARQAFNTYSHWGDTVRGNSDPFGRQMTRTIKGEVDRDDSEIDKAIELVLAG